MRVVRLQTATGPAMAIADEDHSYRILPERDSTALIERTPDEEALRRLSIRATSVSVDGPPLLAPISDPGKIVAIGLNYMDHATEVQMPLPTEPLVFAKFPSSIVGPGAYIAWSEDVTTTVDYEAELAVIIGNRARRVPPERAIDHVFGYTCLNDVSARDLQFRDGQWVRGKSLDTFCPIGPWMVTADEVPDPQALRVRCVVGGDAVQDGNTGDMIFGVAELVARLSTWFTLEPGDVIATGTPPGVGYSRTPRRFIRDGERIVVDIERVGSLVNTARILREWWG